MGRKRGAWLVGGGVAVVLVYYLVGVTLFPTLLLPVGCSGTLGDTRPAQAPDTEFNFSYDATRDVLTVRQSGGPQLHANTTDRLAIIFETSQNTTTITWVEAEGTYPIERGDSVTIQSSTGAGPDRDNYTALVEWTGRWSTTPRRPDYCPSGGNQGNTTATLAREQF